MTQWDERTEQLWRSVLNTVANISAYADHEPLDVGWAHQAADAAAAKLRQHLESAGTPLADVLADPQTRPRLDALAATLPPPVSVDDAVHHLQTGRID
jgi:hypothetical protein